MQIYFCIISNKFANNQENTFTFTAMIELITEEQAKDILAPHLAVVKAIMIESLEDLNKALSIIPESVNKRAKCSLLHSIAIEKSKKHFANVSDVHISLKYQSIQIIFNKKLVGRIKKVNKDNKCSNAKTNRNDSILSQQLTLFPDVSSTTFIDLGYEMDTTWAEYKRHIVVCRLNDSIEWHIDFTDISENAISLTAKKADPLSLKEEVQIKIKKTKNQ